MMPGPEPEPKPEEPELEHEQGLCAHEPVGGAAVPRVDVHVRRSSARGDDHAARILEHTSEPAPASDLIAAPV